MFSGALLFKASSGKVLSAGRLAKLFQSLRGLSTASAAHDDGDTIPHQDTQKHEQWPHDARASTLCCSCGELSHELLLQPNQPRALQ